LPHVTLHERDGFAEVALRSFLQGGSEWSGQAATAAQHRAVTDRTLVGGVTEKLRAVSAENGGGLASLGRAVTYPLR
jgi:hypothetical protein